MRRHDDPPTGALLDTIADTGLTARDAADDVELAVHLERAPRAPLETWVRVTDAGRVVRALSADVSESGIRLAATARPVAEPGADVQLEFTLPGAPPRTLRAAARAVREAGAAAYGAVALAFTRLEEEDREALATFVGGAGSPEGA